MKPNTPNTTGNGNTPGNTIDPNFLPYVMTELMNKLTATAVESSGTRETGDPSEFLNMIMGLAQQVLPAIAQAQAHAQGPQDAQVPRIMAPTPPTTPTVSSKRCSDCSTSSNAVPQQQQFRPHQGKIEEDHEPELPLTPRTDDLHYALNVTLEDLYKGKNKKLTLTRKRFSGTEPNIQYYEEKKKLIVQITPGMYEGQTIYFKNEADAKPNHETGDVIITIKETDHSYFDREEINDLSIMRNISLSELFYCQQRIKHLDGRIIEFYTEPDDILHKREALRKISNEGMPIFKDPQGRRGDLYIHFNLVMPEKLTDKQLKLLQQVAPPYEYDEDDISVPSGPNGPSGPKPSDPSGPSVIRKILEQLTDDDLQKLQGSYEDDYGTFYGDDDSYDDDDNDDDNNDDDNDDDNDAARYEDTEGDEDVVYEIDKIDDEDSPLFDTMGSEPENENITDKVVSAPIPVSVPTVPEPVVPIVPDPVPVVVTVSKKQSRKTSKPSKKSSTKKPKETKKGK